MSFAALVTTPSCSAFPSMNNLISSRWRRERSSIKVESAFFSFLSNPIMTIYFSHCSLHYCFEFWTLFSIYFQTNFILFFIRTMVGNLKLYGRILLTKYFIIVVVSNFYFFFSD
jgi:hypothetical protein